MKVASGLIVASANFEVDASGQLGVGMAATTDRMIGVLGGLAHPGNAAFLYGIVTNPMFPSTTTSRGAAYYGGVASAAAAFTMASAIGFMAVNPTVGAGSAITEAAGFYALNQGGSGVGIAYGLVVNAQSGGSTFNAAARLDGGTQANLWLNSNTAGPGGGALFGTGSDTSLFRGSAGSLSIGDGTGANAGVVLTSNRSLGHLMAMGV